jgi:MFS transporter, AAHS family, 4-hydroxybenzoate transporter
MKIDVAQFIDERPLSNFQRRIYASGMLITLLDGLDLQTVSLAAPVLAEQWGVSAKDFGAVFAAGPMGMALGALTLGALADRIGRKRLIIIATVVFGLCSLLTVFAGTLSTLALLRFLTGIGLGGVMPNLIALSSEYAPSRLRGTLTTLTFCGLSLGSMLGGVLGAGLMPMYGWQSIFIVGGIMPLLVAAWLPWGLPESIRFLVARGEQSDRIAQTLRRIAPAEMISADATFTVPDASTEKASFLRLFGHGRTTPTVLLTLIVVLNSFSLYFVLNWLPTLMKLGGLSTRDALLSSVVLNGAGGVGAVVIGSLMDRYGSVRIMSLTCLLAACGVASIGIAAGSAISLIPVLIVAGGTVLCTLLGMYVVIAEIYPTPIRATGAGFALGVGRVGSMIGPMAGGWALAASWSMPQAFFMAAVPVLLGAVLLQTVARVPRRF